MRFRRPRFSLVSCCALLFLVTSPVHAATPTHLWSKRFGSTLGSEIGRGMVTDSNGSLYVTGTFSGTVDFGGGALVGAGSTDAFLAKYDTNGNHIWSKRFGNTGNDGGYAMVTDDLGNVYVTGYFNISADFGGGTLFSAGGSDIFMAKYNSAGIHQWSRRVGSTGSDVGLDICYDTSGSLYLTGQFAGTVSFGGANLVSNGNTDLFLAKYDTNNAFIASVSFGGTGFEAGRALTNDAVGNVVVTGYFDNTVNFGGGPLVANGANSEMFVAKYNNNFGHIWSKRFGDTGSDLGYGVECDEVSNVYLAAGFSGTVDFGGGPLVSAGSLDAALIKLDFSGAHVWSKRFGAGNFDAAFALALDSDNNIYLTGDFMDSADFGGGPLAYQGSDEIFLAKYDNNGNHIWSKGFGSISYDGGHALTTDASDNVYFTGEFTNIVDFGGGGLISAGNNDIFVAKYASATTEPLIMSITDIGNDQGRKVNIRFERSGYDAFPSGFPVTSYEAYRRDDAPPAASSAWRDPAGLSAGELRADGWTFAGSVPAHGESTYGMDAPTIGDSTITLGQYYSVFYIRAATSQPTVFFDSAPDSGYSLDNLAPGIPQNLVFVAGGLSWAESSADDFDYFTVYGSNSDSFGAATLVDYSVGTAMDVSGSPYVYYYVTATDFSGNEGKPAKVNTLSGVGGTPKNYVLSVSNYPNPFNPRTTVSYTVPSRGNVTVAIYDTRGARVAMLISNETRAAGAYSVEWDGRDETGVPAASGVYFARIEHASGTRTKKMVLLK